RVAMPHGDLMILQRLMIYRYAKRRADLVLPGVTLSDVAAVVEERSKFARRLKSLLDALCQCDHFRLVASKGYDCSLDRSKVRMQMQNGSLLAPFEFLLFVCIH